MEKKVCFKGDGTTETGAKIIKALERLGGRNTQRFTGNAVGYYSIDNNQNIVTIIPVIEDFIPDNPDDYLNEKPYPKWMWVSDVSESMAKDRKRKVMVYGEVENERIGKQYVADNYESSCFFGYKYAVDIPEEHTEQELIRKEIEELKVKLNELERRVK